MSERKFKAARYVNPPFVLVRWGKNRPGLCFGIVKCREDMTTQLYNYNDGTKVWLCQLIQKGSYMSCLKGFDRCAKFDRIVRENKLEQLNKRLV